MIRPLIAIAALVASVTASAGELDGKGLICRGEYDPFLWYLFDENEVKHTRLRMNGDTGKAEIERGSQGEYKVSATEIRWFTSYFWYYLDRATLKLRQKEPGLGGTVYFTWQCSVTDRAGLERSIENSTARAQYTLDQQIKNNKI